MLIIMAHLIGQEFDFVLVGGNGCCSLFERSSHSLLILFLREPWRENWLLLVSCSFWVLVLICVFCIPNIFIQVLDSWEDELRLLQRISQAGLDIMILSINFWRSFCIALLQVIEIDLACVLIIFERLSTFDGGSHVAQSYGLWKCQRISGCSTSWSGSGLILRETQRFLSPTWDLLLL